MENVPILDLAQVAGGSLQEKANAAIQKVLDNMQDPNTPWKNKRSVTIKLSFVQNEERDDAAMEISVETKLAPVSPTVTRVAIGKDLETGQSYAQEYGKQVRGQMSLDDYHSEQIIGNDVVDTDTGEVIGKVRDFRAKEA